MKPLTSPDIEEIRAAGDRIAGRVVRTPLIRLDAPDAPAEIYLKLENLQPIGSFKLRGAGSAMTALQPEQLSQGVVTASAGNMAQGVAWMARELGIPCHVVVPDSAPRTKLDAIRRLGAQTITEPFDRWWEVLSRGHHPGLAGRFVHPVSDRQVIAGNGTIGLEIVEDLPDVDAVVVPFGGGGLSCGIASALGALRPGVPVYAAEVDTAAPLSASLAVGHPATVTYVPSFVDGIGSGGLLEEMWPIARDLLAGSITVGIEAVADAVRALVESNHIVAEGAGATSVAAALSGGAGGGKVVCVVSGGNIDRDVLAAILGHRSYPSAEA